MIKKLVLKLDLYDEKSKRKALKTVSGLPGVESIALDMKDKTLTIIGDVDPLDVASRLRHKWNTELVSFGPAKDTDKKDEGNKDAYQPYNLHTNPCYNDTPVQSAENNPNTCVIC